MCLLYPSRPYLGFPTLAPSHPLVSRSFDRAAALLGSARLTCRLDRAGTEGKSNISPTTSPVRLVRFPMSIHHIAGPSRGLHGACLGWLITRKRTEATSDAAWRWKRLRVVPSLTNIHHSRPVFSFPAMWILWVGFGVPQQLFVATLGVRHFFSCLPVGSLPSPEALSVICTTLTPPLHHLLPPSCQDGFRCAEQRAPALDVKHLRTNHLHLGASLPGTGISVFRRAQRASRLPCSPPPRYPSFSVLPNWPYALFSLIASLPVAVHPRPRRTPID